MQKVELENAYLHFIFGNWKNDSSEFFKESLWQKLVHLFLILATIVNKMNKIYRKSDEVKT